MKLTRSQAAFVLTGAALVLTGIQTILEPNAVWTLIIVTAISGVTMWKQTLSMEIDDKAIKATIVATIVMLGGAANDFLDIRELPLEWEQGLRKGVAFTLFIINGASSWIFPSAERKEVMAFKNELAQEIKLEKEVLKEK